MAFPWTFEANFELGTDDDFDAETDTESRLDFPHYSELARTPGLAMPYRGAHCMRVNLANDGSPANAFVQENTSFDTALNGSIFFRFMLWFGGSPTMANNDEFVIAQLQSTGAVGEVSVVINYTTANGYRLGIGETSGAQFLPLTLNEWHAVEVKAELDDGASNDGTIDAWLDGAAFTQVTGLDQAAISEAVFGVVGQDAGTTRGTVLFDWIVADDARIFPPDRRFAETFTVTKSGHLFVGPGKVCNITLRAGAATDCIARLFDTDVGNTDDRSDALIDLGNTANSETVDPAGVPVDVIRGAYLHLEGTNPVAVVKIEPKMWGSDGAIRNYAMRRTPAPRNV